MEFTELVAAEMASSVHLKICRKEDHWLSEEAFA